MPSPLPFARPSVARLVIVAALLLVAAGCGDAPAPPLPSVGPPATVERPRVEVPSPTPVLRGATRNEALAEVLTDRLIGLGEKLQIRDFDGLAPWLADGFLGEDPWAVGGSRVEDLPLDARRAVHERVPGEVLDREAFVDRLAAHVGDWRRVTQVNVKLLGVTFQDPGGRERLVEWGRARIKLHVVGEAADGTFDALTAKGLARVVNDGGRWSLERLRIDSRERVTRAGAVYSEVGRAAGVAHDGPAFGAPGNDSVAWSGAAAGDVDGDGLFDLFVPGGTRSFLYRNRGDGTFAEESAARGLGAEQQGTGCVFLDFDRDGDQDLVVAHVGWTELTGAPGGRPLALYENDGRGRFSDVTTERGLGQRHASYSLTAFDGDGDGWIDLFVCGYGRMEHERNDSWLRASNGEPDLYLRNEGGSFVDATAAAGFGDRAWGYGAAAADHDGDGDQDLFVANNFGACSLWRNRGDGTFEDVARALGVEAPGNVMGATWGDLDHDGHLDLYLASPTSVAGSRMLAHLDLDGRDRAARNLRQLALGNRLFFGDGAGGFEEAPPGHGAASAGWSWSAHLTDLDLDGGLDVACVNGFVTGELTGDT